MTIIPAATFLLDPRTLRGLASAGRQLALVAQPVSVLKESTELQVPAQLTLALRDADVAIDPERLRVFRLDREEDFGVEVPLEAADFTLVDSVDPRPGISGALEGVNTGLRGLGSKVTKSRVRTWPIRQVSPSKPP